MLKKKATWNYRIIAHEYRGEIWFEIHIVHYTNLIPHGYGITTYNAGGETIKELKADYKRIGLALNKPILWAGDKFPQEYQKV